MSACQRLLNWLFGRCPYRYYGAVHNVYYGGRRHRNVLVVGEDGRCTLHKNHGGQHLIDIKGMEL